MRSQRWVQVLRLLKEVGDRDAFGKNNCRTPRHPESHLTDTPQTQWLLDDVLFLTALRLGSPSAKQI